MHSSYLIWVIQSAAYTKIARQKITITDFKSVLEYLAMNF